MSPICYRKLFLKKGSPILHKEDIMSLVHRKIMWRSVLKLVNMLELAKIGIEWEWQEVSGIRYYIRIWMLSLHTIWFFINFLVNESFFLCVPYSYCFVLLKNEAVNKRHFTRNFDMARFCCQNCLLNILVYHVLLDIGRMTHI